MRDWDNFVPSVIQIQDLTVSIHKKIIGEIVCKGGELKAKDVIPMLLFALDYPII
jgi:hypothetical protein